MDWARDWAGENKCEHSCSRETSAKLVSWETEKKNGAIILRFILGGRWNWVRILSKGGMWG
jgi:hypothetical protein